MTADTAEREPANGFDLDETIASLRTAKAELADALNGNRWHDALIATERISSMLPVLGRHLDTLIAVSQHNQITEIYNAAVDQHNNAIDAIAEAGELPGWRIGDIQACGCPVEPVAVPCEAHETEWGQAMTDCGDCRYGVPGVRHYANGCEAGQ